jgi:hypothetical protein
MCAVADRPVLPSCEGGTEVEGALEVGSVGEVVQHRPPHHLVRPTPRRQVPHQRLPRRVRSWGGQVGPSRMRQSQDRGGMSCSN